MKPSEAAQLPLEEKERLCRQLLAEFGVIRVRQSGYELIHSCPLPFGLHKNGDIHPSAALNFEKLVFCCYGCGNSGSLLWFIGTCRGTTATEARKWLGDQTATDERNLPQLLSHLDEIYGPEGRKIAPPIPKLSERVLDAWGELHPYLVERGISEDNLRRFRVGFNPDENRIVIPHFFNGDLVGWQMRRIDDDGSPKYLSSVDNPKAETLFNYDPGQNVVVVEGPLAVVAKDHLAHIEATFGAMVTDRQIRLLAQHRRVVLAFDNDKAGWRATLRVGQALESYCEVYVLGYLWTEDLDDLPDEEVERLLKEEVVPFPLWHPPVEIYRYRDVVAA